MQWTARPEFPIEEALRAPVPKPALTQSRSSTTSAPPPASFSKSLNLPSVGVPSIYVSLKYMFNNKEYSFDILLFKFLEFAMLMNIVILNSMLKKPLTVLVLMLLLLLTKQVI